MENNVNAGYVSGEIYQNNTIIYHAKIDTSVKRLEKDFNDGNIKQAMDDLSSLLEENRTNAAIKYQLLVKKSSFLFSLRKHDEAINLVGSIEKNYNKFLDTTYEEIRLIVLSRQKQEEEFFALVDKMISESTKDLKRVKFELMYCLNINNIEKAKIIFENLAEEEKKGKELSMMGGHIYAGINEYEGANIYYQIALSYDISFLDNMIIYGFYGTDIINKYMYKQILPENYKKTLIVYKQMIERVLLNEKYFESTYVVNLKNIYLFTLLILDDVSSYTGFFEQEKKHEYIWNQHYFYYVSIHNIPIDHSSIQQKINKNNDEMLLMQYLHLIEKGRKDTDIVINFLDENLDYVYKNKFVLRFYVQGKLFIKEGVTDDVEKYLVSHKYTSIEYLLSYMDLYKGVANKIKQEDIDKLLLMASEERIISARIIEVLHVLKNLGKRKEYLDLAIDKQHIFDSIIEEVFSLIYKDKDLLLKDFEEFVSKIDLKKYRGHIADIYDIYEKYDRAFEYYYELWKGEEEQSIKINMAFKLLELSRKFYERYLGRVNESREDEILKFLLSNHDRIEFVDKVHIAFYLLTVDKNIDEFLKFINMSLLSIDIQAISYDSKLNLSALYYNLLTNYPTLNTDEIIGNKIYLKDGKYFINKENYKKIDPNNLKIYNIELRNSTSWNKLAYNEKYEKKSLFHLLLNSFIYSLENPNVQKIEVNLETKDFSKIFDIMKEMGKQEKENIEHYSGGGYIPFYILAKKEYRQYFGLLPKLLEDNEIIFDTGKPYLQPYNKKILTLSSLVFVDYLGHLEQILKREDIYIQQTLVNWLFALINELDNKDSELSMGSDGKNIYRYENSKEDLEKIIRKIGTLINNIEEEKIIDDTKVSFSIREAGKVLNNTIGVQEFQAIAYCMENDFQIISEDRMFVFMFDSLKLNPSMVSNSISILRDTINEHDMLELEKRLHSRNYKSLLNCIEEDKLIQILNYGRFQNLLSERHIYWFRIWYEYGCLDNIIHKYINDYKVLFPKISRTIDDNFSKNMEYLLEITKEEINQIGK